MYLATGMLLKRAQRGQLPLVEAVKKLQAELLAGPSLSAGDPEEALVSNAKKCALLLLGSAYQKFLDKIEEQQEVLAGITDVAMNAYVMESVYLRAKRIKSPIAAAVSQVFLREAMGEIEISARTVLAACAEGDALRTSMAALKRFTKFEPVNSIELRHQIAARLLQAERYTL